MFDPSLPAADPQLLPRPSSPTPDIEELNHLRALVLQQQATAFQSLQLAQRNATLSHW